MWYVVMSKSIGPREPIRGRESENRDWMKQQHEAGRVLFGGPTTEGASGSCAGSSKEDVAQVLQTHPWVNDGRRDVGRDRPAWPARPWLSLAASAFDCAAPRLHLD